MAGLAASLIGAAGKVTGNPGGGHCAACFDSRSQASRHFQ